MKTWQKATFVFVLILFVAASVVISLGALSRPTYRYELQSAADGGAVDGWAFYAFSGNAGTKTLYIDFVRDKDGNIADGSDPVLGVRKYAVNADEYAEEIVIGASVRYIDEYAFFNVKKLQRVTVDPANEWFKDVDGVLFTKDGKTLILYPVCYGQKPTGEKDRRGDEIYSYPDSYAVPDGVERIGSFAFLKNGHLRDVTLPDTLREIGDMAFFDCGRLGTYDYDAGTDTLEGTGFSLPEGIEKIGSDAFGKCGGIAPLIYLPTSVKEIGNHAFFSCGGVKDVYLAAADESQIETGDAWLPKSIKFGAAWKAPEPQYGKTRADAQTLIEQYRTDKLNALREEAKGNG
ncbi:MAG: leucine-rich repeat domain-containing protein [Clostridia bacterium]|nr:leucine-rich repeat domain-containing protein [Clostridia bacterium]